MYSETHIMSAVWHSTWELKRCSTYKSSEPFFWVHSRPLHPKSRRFCFTACPKSFSDRQLKA